MALLEAKNISYYFQDGEMRRYILENVSQSFEAGTFYAILGESGSGKTTLLSILSALDSPKEGDVFFQDINLKDMGMDNYRRNHAGIVFQSFNLIPYLTGLENVLLAMSITENDLPSDRKSTAYNLLNYIGIDQAKADRLVTKLSGGEKQRVAIARTLAANVEIMFADEPTGALDTNTAQEIVNIFKDLAHSHGRCIIMVTHSLKVAKQADVLFKIEDGALTEVTSFADIEILD